MGILLLVLIYLQIRQISKNGILADPNINTNGKLNDKSSKKMNTPVESAETSKNLTMVEKPIRNSRRAKSIVSDTESNMDRELENELLSLNTLCVVNEDQPMNQNSKLEMENPNRELLNIYLDDVRKIPTRFSENSTFDHNERVNVSTPPTITPKLESTPQVVEVVKNEVKNLMSVEVVQNEAGTHNGMSSASSESSITSSSSRKSARSGVSLLSASDLKKIKKNKKQEN